VFIAAAVDAEVIYFVTYCETMLTNFGSGSGVKKVKPVATETPVEEEFEIPDED